MLSVLFFCVYMLVCSFIMLQLIIGVIVDSIETAETMEVMAISQVRTWVCGWVGWAWVGGLYCGKFLVDWLWTVPLIVDIHIAELGRGWLLMPPSMRL